MIALNIGNTELKSTVQGLLSLCSVNVSETGNVLVCDDTFAEAASHDHSKSGVIVICQKPAYLYSEVHSALEESYKDRYATFKSPFVYSEFIDTVHRFSAAASTPAVQYASTKLSYSAEDCTVTYGDQTVTLSPKEMALFVSLHRRGGNPVSRDTLKEEVWNNSTEEGTNIVDVYISYLRKKLNPLFGDGSIVSRRGMGYMLILP